MASGQLPTVGARVPLKSNCTTGNLGLAKLSKVSVHKSEVHELSPLLFDSESQTLALAHSRDFRSKKSGSIKPSSQSSYKPIKLPGLSCRPQRAGLIILPARVPRKDASAIEPSTY